MLDGNEFIRTTGRVALGTVAAHAIAAEVARRARLPVAMVGPGDDHLTRQGETLVGQTDSSAGVGTEARLNRRVRPRAADLLPRVHGNWNLSCSWPITSLLLPSCSE
jgi:hypothetical protein